MPFVLSVSPESRSLFSASFQTFCLTVRAYLSTQKYGLFCSLVVLPLKYLIPGRIRIWKCWFLRRRENGSTRRKTSRSKGENQKQTSITTITNILQQARENAVARFSKKIRLNHLMIVKTDTLNCASCTVSIQCERTSFLASFAILAGKKNISFFFMNSVSADFDPELSKRRHFFFLTPYGYCYCLIGELP